MKIRLGILGVIALVFFSKAVCAEEVRLVNGDVLNGTVLERNEARVVLQHDQLGRIIISRTDIAAPPDPSKKWKTFIDAAANGSFGNVDYQAFRFAAGSVREVEGSRLQLDTAYTTSYTNKNQDQNKLTAGGLQDWYFKDSPWLLFADGRYDYDDFQTWQQRLAGHGGFGYRFIATDSLNVIGRYGLGAAKEWGSPEEDVQPEGLIGIQALWKISDRQALAAESTLYPRIDTNEYRLMSKLEWSLRVDEAAKMNLMAGLFHEYQSQIDPGFKHYNLNVFAGLRFEF